MASYGVSDGYFMPNQGYCTSYGSSAASDAVYKHQRQLLIADLLSQRDAEEYGDDILDVMHEQEVGWFL